MTGFWIDGREVESRGKAAEAEVRNPADGSLVGSVPTGTPEDVDAAVEAARGAFPSWWETSAAKRGEILFAGAEAIKKAVGELAPLLTAEQGKPIGEARMEIFRFAHTLEHYAGMAKNLRGGSVPNLDSDPPRSGLILKRPLGVCAAITPWNFPLSLAGNKLAPGMVTGNTFVLKPASTTPLTVLRAAALLSEAGLPKGVLNVICGPGGSVGAAMCEHPDVAKVGFTGSTPVGKGVMRSAASTVKRVTLELGGSDPFIAMASADIDRAVSACSVGRFFNGGQACLAVKRVFLEEAIYDEFKEKLLAKVSRLTVGPGSDPKNRIGSLHSAGGRREVEEQIADALEKGATLLAGGERPQGAAFEKGNFLLPAVLENVPYESKMSCQEVFGPALPLFKIRGLDEAIQRANQSEFGLGSSIWTRDLDQAMRAAERLEAGYTWINSISKIYDELPFGGFKQSGLGQEHGLEALEHYQLTKSVVLGMGG